MSGPFQSQRPTPLDVPFGVQDPSTNELRTLAVAPAHNLGFRESAAYHFLAAGNASWQLFIDDEPISPESAGRSNSWVWTPKFFAGPVTAELVDESTGEHFVFVLNVAPDPMKFDASGFERMVRRVREEDPELILGEEPALAAIGREGALRNPWVLFMRLRRFRTEFLRSLRAISSRPIQVVTRTRMEVPLNRVRKIDSVSVLGAVRRPQLLRALAEGSRSYAASSASAVDLLNVPHVEATLDGAANRCMSAIVRHVQRHAQRLREDLGQIVNQERPGDAVTALAPRWARRRAVLDAMDQDLSNVLRSTPWSAVTRSEITAAGLNSIAADPLYQRAYRFGWRILCGGLEGEEQDDPTWMGPSWEVFERWCFVETAEDLRQAFPRMSWSRTTCHPTGAPAAWIGETAGRTIELLLQPRFHGSRPGHSARCESISTLCIPDVVLIDTVGQQCRLVVLDAKYRSNRYSILEAMESAHVYHDALRCDRRPPELVLLLVPNAAAALWLGDRSYHDANGVGIWQTGAWERGALIGRLLVT
jgi:Domain of unknown function (DUF2357)/PD-(D/E)XK nuclease superfamily